MKKPATEDLEAFLRRQASEDLVTVLLERADDSDGAIGDAVRAACRHWLEAAARCSTSPDVWPERLLKLYEGDKYGAREDLIDWGSS